MISKFCSSIFSCFYRPKQQLKLYQTVSLEIVDNTLTELKIDNNDNPIELSSANEYELTATEEEEGVEEFGYSSKKLVFKEKHKNSKEKELKFVFVSIKL